MNLENDEAQEIPTLDICVESVRCAAHTLELAAGDIMKLKKSQPLPCSGTECRKEVEDKNTDSFGIASVWKETNPG